MPRQRSVAHTIRTAFEELASAFARLGPILASATASINSRPGPSAGKQPRKRALSLSPERRRALVLHGRYLGGIRGLKPRQRAAVKKIRATKGIRAAIAAAKRFAR